MTTLVYFAYPIDQAKGDTLSIVANLATKLQRTPDLAVYEPGIAWKATGEPDPRVQQVNDFALGSCDVVAAYLPDATRSIGVPMEIQRALDLGIPVVVLVESIARTSWALIGSAATTCINPEDWLVQVRVRGTENTVHMRTVERTWTEIVGVLDEVQPTASFAPLMGCTDLTLPDRKHEGDAGFDLYVSEEVVLEPGVSTNVRTHLAVELPANMWGLIVGRSSTFHGRGLIVNTAIIDQGYRGELLACVYNPGTEPVLVQTGDRLAQLIPMPLLAPTLATGFVPSLCPSDRGEDGFGSTGR